MKLWVARDMDDTLWVYYCDRPQRIDSSFALHSHSSLEWCNEISSKRGCVDIRRSKMYIHELQRAFKLCGIEKEIEL